MTYPPQPGQSPYGQQPEQGGYPPSGSFPQQGDQYGGLGYYPQQGQHPGGFPPQYGYPQPGQYPGDYGGQYGYPPGGYPPGNGPEPPKKKTGLWIGIAAAIVVVALGVFAITAFVAPAFLLDDDDNDDDETNGGDSNIGNSNQHDGPGDHGGGEPEEVLGRLIAGVENDDETALTELACADADQAVQEAILSTDQVDEMQVIGESEQLGNLMHVPVSTIENGTENTGVIELTQEGGSWCWSDLGQPSGDAGGGLGDPDDGIGDGPSFDDEDDYDFDEAADLTEEFIDAINDGDRTAAEDMLCSDPEVLTEDNVEEATDNSADIAIDPSSVETYTWGDYDVEMTGSVDGEEIDGFTILEAAVKDDSEDEFCINDFYY